MEQQPDKLFGERLRGYDAPVPHQAWSRVSANIAPTRKFTWWMSAAAVALIAATAILIYPLRKKSPELAGHVIQPRHEQAPVIHGPDTVATTQENVLNKESTRPAPVAALDSGERPDLKKHEESRHQESREARSENLAITAVSEPEPIVVAMEQTAIPARAQQTMEDPNAGRKTVTIVFSAREVNEKYLAKTSEDQATSQAQEASTLKNMLDKAYDLTHNQSPLGELRQKKNEILAMNFRKDKPRTQND